MITKRYKLYKNFGKCMEISNGTVKALVTVDIGPRVIYYGVKGMNFMHEDIDRLTNKGGEFFDKNFKEGENGIFTADTASGKPKKTCFPTSPTTIPCGWTGWKTARYSRPHRKNSRRFNRLCASKWRTTALLLSRNR